MWSPHGACWSVTKRPSTRFTNWRQACSRCVSLRETRRETHEVPPVGGVARSARRPIGRSVGTVSRSPFDQLSEHFPKDPVTLRPDLEPPATLDGVQQVTDRPDDLLAACCAPDELGPAVSGVADMARKPTAVSCQTSCPRPCLLTSSSADRLTIRHPVAGITSRMRAASRAVSLRPADGGWPGSGGTPGGPAGPGLHRYSR